MTCLIMGWLWKTTKIMNIKVIITAKLHSKLHIKIIIESYYHHYKLFSSYFVPNSLLRSIHAQILWILTHIQWSKSAATVNTMREWRHREGRNLYKIKVLEGMQSGFKPRQSDDRIKTYRIKCYNKSLALTAILERSCK